MDIDELFNDIIFELSGNRFSTEEYECLASEAMDYHAENNAEDLGHLLTNIKLKMIKKAVAKRPVAKKVVVNRVTKKTVGTPEKVESEAPLEESVAAKEAPAAKKVVPTKKPVVIAEGVTGEDLKEAEAKSADLAAKKVDKVAKPTKAEKVPEITPEQAEELKRATEHAGLKVGDKISHPKHGLGEIYAFKFDVKLGRIYGPKVRFETRRMDVSQNVALETKL